MADIYQLYPKPPIGDMQPVYCDQCNSYTLRLFIDDVDCPNWLAIQCVKCSSTNYFDKILRSKIETKNLIEDVICPERVSTDPCKDWRKIDNRIAVLKKWIRKVLK